jgi:hypothetical protein
MDGGSDVDLFSLEAQVNPSLLLNFYFSIVLYGTSTRTAKISSEYILRTGY